LYRIHALSELLIRHTCIKWTSFDLVITKHSTMSLILVLQNRPTRMVYLFGVTFWLNVLLVWAQKCTQSFMTTRFGSICTFWVRVMVLVERFMETIWEHVYTSVYWRIECWKHQFIVSIHVLYAVMGLLSVLDRTSEQCEVLRPIYLSRTNCRRGYISHRRN
jgi:hypothetical protein